MDYFNISLDDRILKSDSSVHLPTPLMLLEITILAYWDDSFSSIPNVTF